MAIKRVVTRICQCCGERKAIPEGANYCTSCSSPSAFASVMDTRNSGASFAIKSITKGGRHD